MLVAEVAPKAKRKKFIANLGRCYFPLSKLRKRPPLRGLFYRPLPCSFSFSFCFITLAILLTNSCSLVNGLGIPFIKSLITEAILTPSGRFSISLAILAQLFLIAACCSLIRLSHGLFILPPFRRSPASFILCCCLIDSFLLAACITACFSPFLTTPLLCLGVASALTPCSLNASAKNSIHVLSCFFFG